MVKLIIGFIGLGNMGGLMVVNFVNVGYIVCVFDLNKVVVNEFVDKGVIVVNDVVECVIGVDIFISMLLVSKYVKLFYLGEMGFINLFDSKILVIDCLIIDVELVC